MTVSTDIPILGGPLVPLPGNPLALPVGQPPQFTYAPTLPAVVCSPAIFPDLQASFFGGVLVNMPLLPRVPDPVEMGGRFLQQMGVAAAPLSPILVQLKALAAVVNLAKNLPTDVAQAVVGVISPLATDVNTVITASTDLVALSLLPLQLTKMCRGFLVGLRVYLVALKSQVTTLIARYLNVNSMIAKATTAANALWLGNATCAKEKLDAKIAALNAHMAAILVPLAIVLVLICFITGGHPVISLPTLDPAELVAAIFDIPIAAIDVLLALLPDLSGYALTC